MKIQTQNIEAETYAIKAGRIEVRHIEPTEGRPHIGYRYELLIDGEPVKNATGIDIRIRADEPVTATVTMYA